MELTFLLFVGMMLLALRVIATVGIQELQEFYSETNKEMEANLIDPKIPPETEIETDEYDWETEVEGDDDDGADEAETEE